MGIIEQELKEKLGIIFFSRILLSSLQRINKNNLIENLMNTKTHIKITIVTHG